MLYFGSISKQDFFIYLFFKSVFIYELSVRIANLINLIAFNFFF